jgi:hypothetical protein
LARCREDHFCPGDGYEHAHKGADYEAGYPALAEPRQLLVNDGLLSVQDANHGVRVTQVVPKTYPGTVERMARVHQAHRLVDIQLLGFQRRRETRNPGYEI